MTKKKKSVLPKVDLMVQRIQLEGYNALRVFVKDMGRLRRSNNTEFVVNERLTPEQVVSLDAWIKEVAPLFLAVEDVLKLIRRETWEAYFRIGGCDGMREVIMLRKVVREFLTAIARRPTFVRIQGIKEDTNDKA